MSILDKISEFIPFVFKWLKESQDRKSNRIALAAQICNSAIEKIMSIIQTMEVLVNDKYGTEKNRQIASVLWSTPSIQILLQNWNSNTWVLDRKRRTKRMRLKFEHLFKELRNKAIRWYDADMACRKSLGITEHNCLVGGDPHKPPTQEEISKNSAAKDYIEKFNEFSNIANEIMNVLKQIS